MGDVLLMLGNASDCGAAPAQIRPANQRITEVIHVLARKTSSTSSQSPSSSFLFFSPNHQESQRDRLEPPSEGAVGHPMA